MCTDSTTVVSVLPSCPLFRLPQQILLWAIFIPEHINWDADFLSRQVLKPREWFLHPQLVEIIWQIFGCVEVDLFASKESTHWPLWYSLSHPAPLGLDALVQTWPRLCLYAFPPVALLPEVLARVHHDRVHLLLVAPRWPDRVWSADFVSLLVGATLPALRSKGKLVSKQRLAHWVVEAIIQAYEMHGIALPLGVRAQSTRGSSSIGIIQGSGSSIKKNLHNLAGIEAYQLARSKATDSQVEENATLEQMSVGEGLLEETRWKGSKARSIGAGFKLFYYGVDSKRNGLGVVLKEEFVRNVLEVKRVSDRVMSLKLEIEGVMLNVVSGYAPQVGCELEEKERFCSVLDEVMESIPTGERVVIGADFNGHVGEGNTGDEEVMGKFGVKERNLEGQMVVDFAKRLDMGVVNTYFQKREEHRVTYKSGGRRTQVVLPDDWETTAEVIRETGRKVLGVSSGRRKEDKETWWWNEEVQDSIQRKRLAKKKWDMDRTEENRQEYKELQRRVKREVSKAKQKAYEELYTRLDTREGEKDLYRLARQRDRDGKDVQQVRVIKDRDGRVLTSEESVQRRWKEYFEELMNEENEREKRVEGVNSVEQKVDKIRKDEVRKALKRMKSGKAVGPDDIPVEVWKCLGEAAVEFLASLFNRVLESENMPEEWRRSVLMPIFKNKGDVQSCSNYRGIKLMSHTMKVWERVVEARLRKVVEICEQQYGFMPRKSTTDAIFALRILMEKYKDGQRELHCVFVDLEKAYDRVPREELWYCMRKSGVAEKYVRVVQDMYERSRTVVRCAVGQTEEFNVEVGLHQRSALSPFLFAIVMDQLSEEVRQESPLTMMFADDILICSESREQVEVNLEMWRFALERRGMKVSRSKTEYMCVNEREGSGTVRLQHEEVKKVQEFKYLGSTVQSNGECGKEVKKRVQAGWNGWRKVSGVLCDRKISARIKGKVYRTVVRPAMLYGLETVSLRKRQESELEVAELKMLRFSLGVTRLDRIRNEYIRGTPHVGRLGDKVREARLRWFGHVQRRKTHQVRKKQLIRLQVKSDLNIIGSDVQSAMLELARLPTRQTLAPPKKSGPAMGPGEELGT
ncbi:hypothetical protein QTP70_001970 [Hemibagrus guttatus]|uniref:ribonuclease H n=1 Tax=Hemibagrus guttatus TaxID=175788 RepID=A0AAE0QXF9_9TELE|nr:hypothetical protein QTP70_001970 [Hemibagrus guttatus]